MFLGSWSTTLNVLLAIPTSILGTFIVMYVFGFTLNTFTVLGLTLVVGIVVDDAIMVLENIYRHREQGAGKVTAALGGRARDHLRGRRGDPGDHGHLPAGGLHEGHHRQVLLPVRRHDHGGGAPLAARGPDPGAHALLAHAGGRGAGGPARALGRTTFARLAAGYQRLLVPALRHRGWVVLAGSALLFVLSLGIVGLLRQEFIPSQDMSRFGIRFQTPVGSNLDATERILSQIERFLQSRPEVDMFGGFVGGFGGGEVNSGFLFVTMKDPADRPVDPKTGRRLTQHEFMAVTRQATSAIPGGRGS